jgi:GNAT superfamily N-acetyltransferase
MSVAPPPGKLAVVVTRLEMTAPPVRPPMPAPLAKLALIHAERPTLSYYRYLFKAVGAPWLWADRLRMGDEALTARIQDERTALYVLYDAGVPAGFGELFARNAKTTEIVYFGMMPDFTGRRFGPYLLDHIVRMAASPADLSKGRVRRLSARDRLPRRPAAAWAGAGGCRSAGAAGQPAVAPDGDLRGVVAGRAAARIAEKQTGD